MRRWWIAGFLLLTVIVVSVVLWPAKPVREEATPPAKEEAIVTQPGRPGGDTASVTERVEYIIRDARGRVKERKVVE